MLTYPDFQYKQIAVHIAGGNKERVRFHADNIIIENSEKKVIFQHSCHRLFALFIIGETTITTPTIYHATRFGFPIILMTRSLRISARINLSAEGNSLLRSKQYQISDERKLEIAKELIRQKISNQIALIKGLRYLSEEDRITLELLNPDSVIMAGNGKELMGIEGNASKLFFNTYFRPLGWKRREPRCKHDIYNLLLDIGYTYLFQFIESMLLLYGFDIYCGVHHTFFYQRKSLVCDIVEPFRCIIDRRLRKAYQLKQIDEKDFIYSHGHYMLQYKNQSKYIALFFKDILSEKEKIFRFCQNYYRWFVREKPIEQFPKYEI